MGIASGVLALTAAMAAAQEPAPKPMSRVERADLMQTAPAHTFYLKNSTQPNDSNEILTALRLMLDPAVKIYLLVRDNAIIIRALPDDLAMASKLIDELDVPRKTYRLTYTLTETDAGKHIGTPRKFSVVVSSGQRVTLKAGSKVPISTGRFDVSSAISETQMTYLDVGYNIDSTLTGASDGAELKVKVERSHVADDKPGVGSQHDPTIRQEVLEDVTLLAPGKTQLVGSFDVPDSTHHLDVEVMMEVVP